MPFDVQAAPRWNKDGSRICFMSPGSRSGLLEFDTREGGLRLRLPQGGLLNGDTKLRLTYYWDPADRIRVGVSPPGIEISQQGFEYGRSSGDLFVLLSYKIHKGTPSWRFSMDSINVPEWMKDRVRQVASQGVDEWVDLVRVDEAGGVTLVRMQEWGHHYGFAVSPDEKFIAYTDMDELHVYDVSKGEVLVPNLPDEVNPGNVSFSPDGSSLAVDGTVRRKYSAIFRVPVPDLSVGEIIESTRRRGIFRFAWSPDGKWIMLGVGSKGDWGVLDLVAVEIESGREIEIAQPYLVAGKWDERYHVAEGID